RSASRSTLRRRSAKRSSAGMRGIFAARAPAVRLSGVRLADLDDLQLARAAGALDFHLVADLVAEQRLADRRLHRDPPFGDVDLGRPDDGERLLAELVLDLDRRPHPDGAVPGPLLDDHRIAEHVLEHEDAALEHALVVLGVVVLGVLGDVAEILRVFDALGYLRAPSRTQLGKLALELGEAVSREEDWLVHCVGVYLSAGRIGRPDRTRCWDSGV